MTRANKIAYYCLNRHGKVWKLGYIYSRRTLHKYANANVPLYICLHIYLYITC